ncbi:MAG: hypothetical protein ABI859_08805, partial [Pseudomonadota bacterium]
MNRGIALLMLWLLYAAGASAGTQVLRYAPGNGVARLEVTTTGAVVLAQEGAGRLLWRYSAGATGFDGGATPDATPCHGAVEIVLVHDDLNHDGLVDPQAGDTARLYVSSSWSAAVPQAFAVSTISAVDISQPRAPRVLWVRDGRTLPDLGLLAASVTPARIRVGSSNRDPRHNVLVFGAGLPLQTRSTANSASGRRLYIVDALDGRLLWSGAASTGNQTFVAMQAAFAGGIAALDLNADGYTDRLYAGDLASSLWRFDVWQGQSVRSLLTGGVIAALANPLTATARGFRSAPDVALLTNAGSQPSFSIGIGTQALPGAGVTADNWFFLVRDLHPFERWTQTRYDTTPALRAADLTLVDTLAATGPGTTSAGLRIPLGAGQVAAQATTAARVSFFTVVEQGVADERFCVTP